MELTLVSILFIAVTIYAGWLRIELKQSEDRVQDWRNISADLSNSCHRIKIGLRECKRRRNKDALELMQLRQFKQRFAALIQFTKKQKRA